MTGERAPLPESRRLLLAAAAALSLSSLGGLIASAGRLPLNLAVAAGVAVAVLAVIGLPSLGADR